MDVESLKKKGNDALAKGHLDEAISCYSKAIELEPENYVLYSNRSAAYATDKKYQLAVDDAEKTIMLKEDWPKGYSRKGAALSLLGRHSEALASYREGLKYDPNNELLLKGVEAEIAFVKTSSQSPLSSLFSDPTFVRKLTSNPKTRDLLSDEKFMESLNDSSQFNADTLSKLQLLLGAAGFGGPSSNAADSENADSGSNRNKEPAAVNLTDDQSRAVVEKDLGNKAYKEHDFALAHQHYDKAIELDPTNITYYNNKAAAYFEEKLYEKCIETCGKSVEIGREHRADFKLIGKAYARMANAYAKLDQLKEALNYYDKSLSEHRDADVVKRRQEVFKKVKELEKNAYFNPELSQEEKQKGNEFFKRGEYPEAVKHYTEAIRRNPGDCVLYSNRAACYTRLMEFELALVDCDKCISIDSKFLKGHLRKAAALMATKQHARAMTAYEEALKLDPNCEEAYNGYRDASAACDQNPDEVRKSAMEDPEVREILNDPAMMHILEQMTKDPNAVKEHLANPEIASKINKLVECGIVRMR